jgi:hypothetical protein
MQIDSVTSARIVDITTLIPSSLLRSLEAILGPLSIRISSPLVRDDDARRASPMADPDRVAATLL